MRFLKFLVVVSVFFGLAGVASRATYAVTGPDRADYSVDDPLTGGSLMYDGTGYEEARGKADMWSRTVALGLLVLLLVPLLPRVAYRGRDVLFVFLPIYNSIFLIKIAWRVASLPEPYWSPRNARPKVARGMPPPGAYPDPEQPEWKRFWDGTRWVGDPWLPPESRH